LSSGSDSHSLKEENNDNNKLQFFINDRDRANRGQNFFR
jgi:hypothetical protein